MIWVGVGPYRQRPWGCEPDDSGWTPTQPITWGEYIEVEDTEKVSDTGYYADSEYEDDEDDED